MHFNYFGKLIARILDSPSNHNIRWLWHLSILSNSVHILYQPLEKLEGLVKQSKIRLNAVDISKVIIFIKDQIKVYSKKYKNKNFNTTKEIKKLLKGFKSSNKYEQIELIDEIYSKLIILDMNIEENFKVVGNNIDNLYTPQNLFFFDIILNKDSVKTLFTKCSAIKWIRCEEHLIQSFNAAMYVWVDEKDNYFELINYRETLIDTVKLSFYIHIKLQSSIAIGYKSGIDRNLFKSNLFIETSWNSIKYLVNNFITFFHLQEDSDLIELNEWFKTRPFDLSFAEKVYKIANRIFRRTNFNYLEIITLADIIQLVENNKIDLKSWSKENVNNLMGYLNKVNDLFENVDFEIYEVFYKIFSNKSENNLLK
ncbi:uncharacterized protein LOC126907535 [Daktulosphaira vitifoliae]|uniref:uncharacterized protein LOC126907535 n=1 Tax=Daktulosphaira vitifoliae TaxID=58002 RepID=UPI0021AAC005|nr:uncharacterized protein LOC126907535 [Daktulosphaira vitifoliae]